MVTLLIIGIALIFIGILFGKLNAFQIDLIIEFKNISSPYYNLGICFNSFPGERNDILQDIKVI